MIWLRYRPKQTITLYTYIKSITKCQLKYVIYYKCIEKRYILEEIIK